MNHTKLIAILIALAIIIISFIYLQPNERMAEPVVDVNIDTQTTSSRSIDSLNDDIRKNPSISELNSELLQIISADSKARTLPYSEKSDLVESIFDTSIQLGWSDETKHRQFQRWSILCEPTYHINLDANSAEDFGRIDAKLLALRYFAETCAGFRDHENLPLQEPLSSQVTDDDFKATMDALVAAFNYSDNEYSASLVIDSLEQALESANLILLEGIVSTLSRSDLIEPPFPTISANTTPFYLQVSREVATTIYCQYYNDCNGFQHPLVLMQCVNRLQTGAICLEPANLNEAIYQTLTPNEYDVYLALYSQILNFIR